MKTSQITEEYGTVLIIAQRGQTSLQGWAIVFLPVFTCHSAESVAFFRAKKIRFKAKNVLLEILSVTNLNSTGKFPQNGIEVATVYFVSKVHDYLIQIEILLNAKCLFPFKYHNFSSFSTNFQSKKGPSLPMPIFKVTAEEPGAFDVF